jgi:hypothetical protein
MTVIRFTSHIDPTWNQGEVDKRAPKTGRRNVITSRRKDSLPPEVVNSYMNFWAFRTLRYKRQKLAKNHPNGDNSL